MHSEIVPPQGRLRASIAAGIVIAALCFVVAALEHTIDRLTEEGQALRAELARSKAMTWPACGTWPGHGSITSSGAISLPVTSSSR